MINNIIHLNIKSLKDCFHYMLFSKIEHVFPKV